MKFLWFTWKDLQHPAAGGAEVINETLAQKLVQDGHEVTLIVGGFKDCIKEEIINGYNVIRVGNRWTIYWKAYQYYKKNLQGWADIVIEEINTVPFFTQFYTKEKKILFVHQLCREIWFYQIIVPLSLIGYFIEPLYLWLLRKNNVITVSNSTKSDLVKYGYQPDNIHIISEGIEIEPINDISDIQKNETFTMLALGAIREMKRLDHQISAFELAKEKIPELQLIIAGASEGSYGTKMLKTITQSKYKKDIIYKGKVSRAEKIKLMQTSHFIAVTSVKEGWGLIVTEANSQGTPAIVYNVDGLKDSVKNNETGLITTENNPQALADTIVKLHQDKNLYVQLQKNALEWSKQITFDKSYQQFSTILHEL